LCRKIRGIGRNLLSESELLEKKSFVKSFVKEMKATGDEVLVTYTLPLLPKGVSEEKLSVLPSVNHGGRSCTVARTFEVILSL
jgi:hypothetical protein